MKLASKEIPKESLKLIQKNEKGDEVIYCKALLDLNGNPQKVGCKIAERKRVMENSRMCVKLFFFLLENVRFVYYMPS